ncbi:MAG: metallophosphoesterase [Bacteroidales bacterium]|nr:metallophosphoesterase [Bacteroidales bacterium]
MKKSEYFLLVMIFLCASCAKDQWNDPPGLLPGNNSPFNRISPQIKIAVVSDIHYMDPSIAPDDPENNQYWQDYVSHDRKIFELSDPIFRKVVSELMVEKPDILLIPGDLAKEGELLCHETVKGLLEQLENEGIQVYVVPGNNDIGNPDAKDYKTDPPSAIPGITEEDFATIFEDFGFNEALYRDENSLSYICQPHEKLWILGIDGVKRSASGVSGAINPATLVWIQEKMIEAREKNIEVLAMMHYGIAEHYTGQKNLEPLIKSSKDNAIALMNAGVRLIFTGHYHANDIVYFTNEGDTLSDIQTGSLVTPPYSYRMMKLDDNFIKIDTRRVTGIDIELPGGKDFVTWSDELITNRLNGFFTYYGAYVQKIYQIPAEDYPITVPYIIKAYKAYFAGDETISLEEMEKITDLGQSVPSVLPLLDSFWSDLLPGDNKIHIMLKEIHGPVGPVRHR